MKEFQEEEGQIVIYGAREHNPHPHLLLPLEEPSDPFEKIHDP